MWFDISSLEVNLSITALVAVMVFLMPWVDRKVASHYELNLQGGLSDNPRAEGLLQLRSLVLYGIFAAYLAVVAYLVFFSRTAAMDYRVHTKLFENLRGSINIDLGIFDLLRLFFVYGVPETLKHVQIVNPFELAQFYLNVMLFVPMGYLLPYGFRWFREKVEIRPVVTSLLISFLIENVQLITKQADPSRGFKRHGVSPWPRQDRGRDPLIERRGRAPDAIPHHIGEAALSRQEAT